MKHLLVRADANSAIGAGHVMRCHSLAQEWKQQGGDVTFIMKEHANLRERIEQDEFSVEILNAQAYSSDDALETVRHAKKNNASWIMVDGYNFGTDYQRALKNGGLSVLLVDDYGHGIPFSADIVLNQNCYAKDDMYGEQSGNTKFLLGCKYTVLRREFIENAPKRNTPEVVKNILITLGGGDGGGILPLVLRALESLHPKNLHTSLILGGGYPDLDAIRKQIGSMQSQIELHVNTIKMRHLMEQADLAISAGGSTCYELAYMGVPTLTLALAENQRPTTKTLDRLGVAKNLGWYSELTEKAIVNAICNLISDASLRSKMAERGQKLVDGKGVKRVIEAMLNHPLK